MAKHPPPLLIIFFVWGKIPFSLLWLPFNFIQEKNYCSARVWEDGGDPDDVLVPCCHCCLQRQDHHKGFAKTPIHHHNHDKIKGTEGRAPSKLLQLRFCLAFHTGFEHIPIILALNFFLCLCLALNTDFNSSIPSQVPQPTDYYSCCLREIVTNNLMPLFPAERPPDAQYNQLCISIPGDAAVNA